MIYRDTDIVSKVVAQLERQLGAERFDTWFGTETRIELARGEICVVADSDFRMERLRKTFLREIQSAVTATLGPDANVAFRIDPELSAEPSESQGTAGAERSIALVDNSAEPNAAPVAAGPRVSAASTGAPTEANAARGKIRSGSQLTSLSQSFARPEGAAGRKFANLQTLQRGTSNQVAIRAAEIMLRSPGTINPLFVHGPSGTGKTHLLEGIWVEARRRGGRRVIYLSAEQFTTYFLQALRGSGLPNFRQKYRGVDLLIIDDIQFFEGKQATITELLHTIETLQREGRQVVLAADRSPTELSSLGAELLARIQSGLVCALESLDRKTRRAVLEQMAQLRDLQLTEQDLDVIADRTPGDARQLTGLINRLWATSEAHDAALSHEQIVTILDDLYPVSSAVVKLDDIQRVVCDEFGIDATTLKSSQRSRRISYPRMLAMWLARKHTQAALAEIGDFFGRKSHSTVVSAQLKVSNWVNVGEEIDTPQQTRRDVRLIVKRLEQQLHAS
ncbi:MAG: ATP-binding protein [Planctomycetales bacterium]|nr:ATP-binding protein [Planctomycetales bacterium]